MKTQSVCIIGNLNIDIIIRNVPHLPCWGQEVFGSSYIQVSSGQAAYTGFSLRKMQVPTSIISLVGNDKYGQSIIHDLQQNGIDISGSEVWENVHTGITVAVVRDDGERAFISDPACLRSFSEKIVLRHWGEIENAEFVCMVGLFFTPGLSLVDAERILAKVRKSKKTTVLDTGWDPDGWQQPTIEGLKGILKHVNIFLPNMDEAYAITGKSSPEDASLALQSLGPELVVIKLGSNGSYARQGQESFRLPAIPVQVFDAVGAGDVFNAGFIYGLIKEWPIPRCMAFGTAASALYISRPINRFPDLNEVMQAADTNP
jgi:sugar/nucleoside kinase (ribokinase family)